ncbi:MAG: apolipoprotein N-acyltransferase [Ilumatobacteraceae bacterium]
MPRPTLAGLRRRPQAISVTAAVLGGLAVALAMPPWGFWPLAFAGTALLDLASSSADRRRRGLIGFAFGAGWMLLALAWIWFLTPPGYVIAALLFASLHAVAAAIAPTGRWGSIGRPAAHTLAEIVRISIPFGGVPLATLGIAQAGGPLLPVARIGGVIVLTWLVFQVGALMASAVRAAVALLASGRLRPLDRPTGFALTTIVVTVIAAVLSPTGASTGSTLSIAAVQGGGRQGTSALQVPSRIVTERHLEATRSIEASDELDLVVWPENSIDVNGEPFAGSAAAVDVAAEARRLGVPIAVGITIDSEFSAHPEPGKFVNAQVVVTPDGEVTSGYEKVRIVPFGEYVPLRGLLTAVGAPLDQIPSDALSGRDPAVIDLPDGTGLGVMISYEVFFGGRGRAAGDAAILLNPTNGASYTWTIVQSQQIASSKLRAAENGRWVVQVAPTGFSAFVAPDGEVFERTDVGEQRVIVMDVPMRSGSTVYSTTGDLPWIGLCLGVFGLVVRRTKRLEVDDPAEDRPAQPS